MAKKTELEENIEAVETEEVETPKKSGLKKSLLYYLEKNFKR